jgi:hypothetical protein
MHAVSDAGLLELKKPSLRPRIAAQQDFLRSKESKHGQVFTSRAVLGFPDCLGVIFAKRANSQKELEKAVKNIMASARSLMPSVERPLDEIRRDG